MISSRLPDKDLASAAIAEVIAIGDRTDVAALEAHVQRAGAFMLAVGYAVQPLVAHHLQRIKHMAGEAQPAGILEDLVLRLVPICRKVADDAGSDGPDVASLVVLGAGLAREILNRGAAEFAKPRGRAH